MLPELDMRWSSIQGKRTLWPFGATAGGWTVLVRQVILERNTLHHYTSVDREQNVSVKAHGL